MTHYSRVLQRSQLTVTVEVVVRKIPVRLQLWDEDWMRLRQRSHILRRYIVTA
jgi:hypothetical protein